MTDSERLLSFLVRRSFRVWWENYARIEDVDAQIVAPRSNAYQAKVVEAYMYCQEAGLPCEIIGLKPRRGGSTTIALGITYHRCRVQARHNAALIVDDKSGKSSTGQRVAAIWKTFVNEDKFALWDQTHSEDMQEFSNGSTLSISSAKEDRAEQGGGLHSLVGSEMAHWPKDGVHEAGKTVTSIRPTLAGSSVFLMYESTPNGMDGAFYDLCQKAVSLDDFKAGKRGNGLIFIFAAWYEFEDHEIDLLPDEVMLLVSELESGMTDAHKYALEMQATLNLRWSQIAWWWEKCRAFNFDLKKMKQEYPTDPDSCFLASGQQRFDQTRLLAMKAMIERGDVRTLYGRLDADRARVAANAAEVRPVFTLGQQSDPANWVLAWRPPQPGRRYLVVADTVTGQATGENPDTSSLGVIGAPYGDYYAGGHCTELVAMAVPAVCEPDVAAWQLALLALWYGNAPIMVETNNSGLAVLAELRNLRGLNIACRTSLVDGRVTDHAGWQTTESTREALIGALAGGIRDFGTPEGFAVYSMAVWDQFWKFIKYRKKWQAAPGSHDDHVIMCGIGLHCRDGAKAYVPPGGGAHGVPLDMVPGAQKRMVSQWS